MKIAFPVNDDFGFESGVYGHFGSARGVVLVDSECMETVDVKNEYRHHVRSDSDCRPIKALGGNRVDAVVVGGIGHGALSRFNLKRMLSAPHHSPVRPGSHFRVPVTRPAADPLRFMPAAEVMEAVAGNQVSDDEPPGRND